VMKRLLFGNGLARRRHSNELRAGRPEFDSQPYQIFLLSAASRPTLGSTQPPIQWVPGAFSSGVKRQECEADHIPPSSAEVKKVPHTSVSSWHTA
jgi:hypothetical protein